MPPPQTDPPEPVIPQPTAAAVARPAAMTLGAVLASVLTSALWGGTPVSVSFSQDELPPVFTAGVRFAQAAAFQNITLTLV